jgi:hypothetical protein
MLKRILIRELVGNITHSVNCHLFPADVIVDSSRRGTPLNCASLAFAVKTPYIVDAEANSVSFSVKSTPCAVFVRVISHLHRQCVRPPQEISFGLGTRWIPMLS